MSNYIDANPASGKTFYQNFSDKGKVVMLNLLKFRSKADYTHLESLDPGRELTGEEAYQLYMEYTLPELEKAGSRVLFSGSALCLLTGNINCPKASRYFFLQRKSYSNGLSKE